MKNKQKIHHTKRQQLVVNPITTISSYLYNPSIDLNSQFSKTKSISKLNYMHSLMSNSDSLIIIKIKIKSNNS